MTYDPKDVVRRHVEVMVNNKQRDRAPEFFHPTFKIGRMGIQKAAEHLVRRREREAGNAVRGSSSSEDFRNMGAEIERAFPDLNLQIGEQFAEGDVVVSKAIFSATHSGEFFGVAPTNRRIEFEEVLIMRMTDGKISEVWALADEYTMLYQLGVFE